jgi:hypothetical protein
MGAALDQIASIKKHPGASVHWSEGAPRHIACGGNNPTSQT